MKRGDKAIIFSLGILLVLAAVSGAFSGYAFYAQSLGASAAFKISARGNPNTYLVIGEEKDVSRTGSSSCHSEESAILAPAAHAEVNSNAVSWFTKASDDPNKAESSWKEISLGETRNGEDLRTDGVDGPRLKEEDSDTEEAIQYVLGHRYYVGVKHGAKDAKNLVVKDVGVQRTSQSGKVIEPVTVLFVLSNPNGGYSGSSEYFLRNGNDLSQTILSPEVAVDLDYELDVYLYYNGNDEDVFTGNIDNLSGAAVSFTLSVEGE